MNMYTFLVCNHSGHCLTASVLMFDKMYVIIYKEKNDLLTLIIKIYEKYQRKQIIPTYLPYFQIQCNRKQRYILIGLK